MSLNVLTGLAATKNTLKKEYTPLVRSLNVLTRLVTAGGKTLAKQYTSKSDHRMF